MELFNFIKDNLINKGYEVTFSNDLLIGRPNAKIVIRKENKISKTVINPYDLEMALFPEGLIREKLRYMIKCIEEIK